MGFIPLPSTVDTVRQKAHTWGNNSRGQRLKFLNIGAGGLSVRRKGKIFIDDGGTLTIVDGNLRLSEGSITGYALKEHMSVDCAQVKKTGYSSIPTRKWTQLLSVTLKRPSWATSGIITGTATVGLVPIEYNSTGVWTPAEGGFAFGRIKIADSLSGKAYAGYVYKPDEKAHEALVATPRLDTVSTSSIINVSLEVFPDTIVGSQYPDYHWVQARRAWANLSAIVWWVKQ